MENKLNKIIKRKETDVFKFKPNTLFYKKISINRKRFGMLLRNEVEITYRELHSLSVFFNVKKEELINDLSE